MLLDIMFPQPGKSMDHKYVLGDNKGTWNNFTLESQTVT